MQIEFIWIFLLAGVVTFVSVFIQIVIRIKPFQRLFSNSSLWSDQIIIILLFGLFSILGTYMGVTLPSGAIVNVRDLAPIVGGLVGGPIIGGAIGLIGGVHRLFLGGLTAIPCAIATILIGLTSGYIRKLNGNSLIKLRWAVLITALMECFHMLLVLLIARPFIDALDAVKTAIFPMILANCAGVAICVLFISHHLEDAANNIRSPDSKNSA